MALVNRLFRAFLNLRRNSKNHILNALKAAENQVEASVLAIIRTHFVDRTLYPVYQIRDLVICLADASKGHRAVADASIQSAHSAPSVAAFG